MAKEICMEIALSSVSANGERAAAGDVTELHKNYSYCNLNLYFDAFLQESLAWGDWWPLTWWTDQLLSFSALTLLVGSFDPQKSSPI